eukprot:jgi/Mesvir1/17635/Mv08857-RA.1
MDRTQADRLQEEMEQRRRTSSKYDFVKVRVWLGEQHNHYYVLSRFLVSRMLTVTKMPPETAIKVALELKKLMVDQGLLDVSQADLEWNLFKVMEQRGYGSQYISRYRMMTRFHHRRVPLAILLCGCPCIGKSTVATQLAQRLNLPNVLQTDLIHTLLKAQAVTPLHQSALWERSLDDDELVREYRRECRAVRIGVEGELMKCLRDGKAVIMEGLHLDPSMYLDLLSANGIHLARAASLATPAAITDACSPEEEAAANAARDNDDDACQLATAEDPSSSSTSPAVANQSQRPPLSCHGEPGVGKVGQQGVERGVERGGGSLPLEPGTGPPTAAATAAAVGDVNHRAGGQGDQEQRGERSSNRLDNPRDPPASGGRHLHGHHYVRQAGSHPNRASSGGGHRHRRVSGEQAGEGAAGAGDAGAGEEGGRRAAGTSKGGKARQRPAGIFAPFVLAMDEEDHEVLLGHWLSRQPAALRSSAAELEALKLKYLHCMELIQGYLRSYESQGIPVLRISPCSLDDTVEQLHDYLLQVIQRGCPDSSSDDDDERMD